MKAERCKLLARRLLSYTIRQRLAKNAVTLAIILPKARKIHYGEAEAEGIYGQTPQDERESLKDEGLDIFDMPWVPSDH